MNEPTTDPEKLLDRAATETLRGLVADLREALIAEAKKLSVGGVITDEDLVRAYQGLAYPSRVALQFADAQAVISQALRENRVLEWVSYVMAVILFFFGLGLLSAGAMTSDVATRVSSLLAGSIVELLILIPFRFAINSRRQNIALRMLGLIINRVDDPKKLAPLLKDTFLTVVLGKANFEVKEK